MDGSALPVPEEVVHLGQPCGLLVALWLRCVGLAWSAGVRFLLLGRLFFFIEDVG